MKKKDNIQKAIFYPKSPKYMVGDIVCSHGFNCIVYGIYPYCGYYSYELKSIEGKELGKICQEDIKEKPLSPEILEKNGWKLQGGGETIYSTEATIQIENIGLYYDFEESLYDEDKEYLLHIDFLDKDKKIVSGTYLEIHYIHQLQHLLFGLGLDNNMIV